MNYIISGIIGIAIVVAGFFGMQQSVPSSVPLSGNFNPSGGGTYRLGQSIGTADVTIKLSSFTEPVSGIKYTMTYLNASVGYGTLSPQSSISEFISFTGVTQNSDGSALLTGVVRGLSRSPAGTASNCTTASTTLAQGHAGQSIFILSNSPCFQAEYAARQNNENISGIWNFQSLPTSTIIATLANQFTIKSYVDSVANQGAATSTFGNGGIVELATHAEAAAGTASSSPTGPLVLLSLYSNATPTSCNSVACIPVAVNSVINANFVATTSAYNWTGPHSYTATTTMATTTMASTTATNGLNVGATATTTFNGGGLNGVYDYQVFTGSGTWTKPTNILGTEMVVVEAWGAGGGGGSSGATGSPGGGGGGGGGACIIGYFRTSDLTSTVTVTVGTGAASSVGGNTTFGTFLTAYGGGAGQNESGANNNSPGGGGGGELSVGAVGNSDTTGGTGGNPAGSASTASNAGFGGAGGGTSVGGAAAYGGGGGGGFTGASNAGGASVCGGGGGAGGGTSASGGTSVLGGAGGAAVADTIGTTGSAPGGGGAGGSRSTGGSKAGGPGGRGEVRVWTYR